MAKRLTQEEFLRRAKAVHGPDRYILHRVTYINAKTKVEIICPEHGSWMITPDNFLHGQGCPKCGIKKASKSKTLTQEEFIERVNKIHQNRYSFSKSVYKGVSEEVEVICPEHGSWWTCPSNLFEGHGCPKCAGTAKLTQEEFIERVKAVHGEGRYDLSRLRYTNAFTKVMVICPKHGAWMAVPQHLAKGVGCPKCGWERTGESRRLTQEEFIAKVKAVHGEGRFDLSRVKYTSSTNKVKVICPKHGSWWARPSSLFRGSGCPKCGREKVSRALSMTQEEFESRVRDIHGDNLDLRNARYESAKSKVEIICPKHGPWLTEPSVLFMGCGCPKCAIERRAITRTLCQSEFENRILSTFGSRADLSMAVYKGVRERVTVRCTEHDVVFESPADSLFAGYWGCPSCINNGKSKGEEEVAQYIESFGLKIERGRRDIIPPKELDIYIPEKNLAIEYNGIAFHNDKMKPRDYHLQKYLACKANGIRLIQILDILWLTKQEQIKSLLAHALGARTNERKIDARKCEVRPVKVGELRDFFDANHIQGHVYTASLALGLFYEDEVVAAMTFSKGGNQRGAARVGRQGAWTLSRYATSRVVRGGFQKLLKHGRDLIGWGHDIVSFSANDYFAGRAYEAAGFVKDAEIGPDYQVYHPRNGLHHKSHWQRRLIPARLAEIGWEGGFDPATDKRTEWEVEDEVGAVRVFDSGKRRWRLRGVDKSHGVV